MIWIYIPAAIIGFAYTLLITAYLAGWVRTGTFRGSRLSGYTRVSVLIPFRNEAASISRLIGALKKQDYPEELTEIIFIDDHSTDTTAITIRLLIRDTPGCILLTNAGEGKKDALWTGYGKCSGDLIITTDADCTFGPGWISSLVSFCEKENPGLIIGPVILAEGPGIFQDLQALEFLSLTGSAGGSAGIGRPILCNGANLAIRKELLPHSIYSLNPRLASGDDIFLLHHVKKQTRHTIRFCKAQAAVVTSVPHHNPRSFWQQRIRWTSKSRAYRDVDSVFASLTVYFINLFLFLSLILAPFVTGMIPVFLGLFTLKSLTDLLFLNSITLFFRKGHLLRYFLPLQVLYIIYASIIPVAGTIGRFNWKGRQYGIHNS